MIRINLLKGSVFQGARPKRAPREGGRKGLVVAGLIVLAVLAAGAGGLFVLTRPKPEPKAEEKRVAQPPSAFALRGIEETVKDVDEAKAVISSKGLLLLPYEEMTQNEKLLYGSMFLRRAFASINGQAGGGVDFNTMRLEKFASFYILGVTQTRDIFLGFRGRLTKDPACSGLEVVSVRPAGYAAGKTRFEIKGRLQYGLDYESLIQSNPFSRIPGHSEFQNLSRRIREMGEPGIRWIGFKALGMEPEGDYRRHALQMEGITTYRTIVEFLNQRLPELNSMVSFPEFHVKALGKGRIRFEAIAFFYTKPD